MRSVALIVLLVAMEFVYAEEVKPSACSSNEYNQFDFWLGKWTSYSIEGKEQGKNHLIKMMGNCLIQENWSSGGGNFKGTSYSFYDQQSKKWNQTWVDSSGGTLDLSGGFVNGSMQLAGDHLDEKGIIVTDRITWTPLEDGRVRQYWQTSSDHGLTWSEVFDGYYQKETE